METVVSLSNSAVLAQGDLYDLCVFKMWSFVDHWMYRVLQKGMMIVAQWHDYASVAANYVRFCQALGLDAVRAECIG